MNNHYREKILAPIRVDNPVGELLSDDDDFDFIETQMMKVGSLSHQDIQWEIIEQKTSMLLTEKTKDLRLLGYLMQCLQHKTTAERFLLSLHILTDFINAYWFECYPNTAKVKFFNQIMQRTEKVIKNLSDDQRVTLSRFGMMNAFSELLTAIKTKELPTDLVEAALSSWAIKHVESEKIVKQRQISEQASSSDETKILPKVELNSGSEKETKTALLAVADFLWHTTDDKSLSLRLRRHAIWCHIHSLPECDDKFESSLMPVCADRVALYQTEIQHSPSIELWQRIERSLTLSPFWIDGHYLSAQLAKTLNQANCALAIKDETRKFISQFADIRQFTFKGGTPFLSQKTQHWLAMKDDKAIKVSVNHCWQDERARAMTLLEQEGLPAALAMLNEGLLQATEQREQFYWRLLSAEIMDEQHLSALAMQEYRTLQIQAEKITLHDWEPSLLQRLDHLVDAE